MNPGELHCRALDRLVSRPRLARRSLRRRGGRLANGRDRHPGPAASREHASAITWIARDEMRENRTEVGSPTDSLGASAADSSGVPSRRRKMRLRLFLPFAAIAIAAAVAGVFALGGRDEEVSNSPTPASEHRTVVPAAARTVLISRAMPMPSAHERRLSAMLEKGTMPDRPIMADVLTDTDCAPDARMISRCRNVVRFASGRQIVLRHPHDMSSIPCLAPGERVRLIPTGV